MQTLFFFPHDIQKKMEDMWSSLYWDVLYVIIIVALLAAIMFMIHEKFCKEDPNCKRASLTLGIVSTVFGAIVIAAIFMYRRRMGRTNITANAKKI